MQKIFVLIAVLFSGLVFSQNLKNIKKLVEQINQTKNYVIKTVPNEYFIDKNMTTDNGIELKGFYKNGKLKKIEHTVGVSFVQYLTEYFFDRDQLIFVHAKKYQILGENGYTKQPELLSEFGYYYENGKLIKTLKKSGNFEENNNYLDEVKTLKKDLKDYK
ncbi:hypothetical protein PFY12_02790 [Chryseobacterium camelliae]|uniref:MORN repeat variant n=1 Tax=Chryseobacterium camelliae TaxID=1265445 RepID=A0ABY7QPU3_9FLAO|nr:hypothetical protein [Chryseobacterium camelliae]WBV61056.1 hypothetical protein PFY12_02790 [Chryseobacterium camelliae]